MLPAVLAGSITTASGFHRHRTVDAPAADQGLRWINDAVRDVDATPVAHVCASEVPVELLAGAGFAAIGFDFAAVDKTAIDSWAEAFEAGVDLWPGVVPAIEPTAPFSVATGVRDVESWYAALGFAPREYARRLTVTPSCGLAGASPAWAPRALAHARHISAGVDGS